MKVPATTKETSFPWSCAREGAGVGAGDCGSEGGTPVRKLAGQVVPGWAENVLPMYRVDLQGDVSGIAPSLAITEEEAGVGDRITDRILMKVARG